MWGLSECHLLYPAEAAVQYSNPGTACDKGGLGRLWSCLPSKYIGLVPDTKQIYTVCSDCVNDLDLLHFSRMYFG